jgi:hypothetical protein
LEKELDSVTYYKKNVHHTKCLREKLLSKKIGRMEEGEVDRLIDGLRCETEKHGMELCIKNHLYKYLQSHYEVVSLPTYIYQKMEDIFNGNWKDMSQPIPACHLLDMFVRRQSDLDKIYHKTKLDGVARINYDTAVLIGKYSGYLEWLGKSKVEATETEKHIENTKQSDIDMLGKLSKQTKKKSTEQKDIFEEEEGLPV